MRVASLTGPLARAVIASGFRASAVSIASRSPSFRAATDPGGAGISSGIFRGVESLALCWGVSTDSTCQTTGWICSLLEFTSAGILSTWDIAVRAGGTPCSVWLAADFPVALNSDAMTFAEPGHKEGGNDEVVRDVKGLLAPAQPTSAAMPLMTANHQKWYAGRWRIRERYQS